MALRTALLILAALVLGAPSGRSLGDAGHAAVAAWRVAVWNSDSHTFDQAGPLLDRAVGDAGPGARRDLLFMWAWSKAAGRDRAAAEDAAARFAAFYPDARERHVLDAQIAERNGEFEAAREGLDTFLAEGAARARGRLFDAEYEFIALTLRSSLSPGPEDLVPIAERARVVAREGGGRMPRWAIEDLAEAHRKLDQLGPAATLLQDAIAADPEYAGHPFELGRIRAAQHRQDDARRWYRRAQELDPDFLPPYLKLAVIEWRAGDLPAMHEQLDQLWRRASRQWRLQPRAREAAMAAEIQAGFGQYWFDVGMKRAADGDDIGARDAYGKAKIHLLRAVEEDGFCTRALNRLIVLGGLIGESQRWIDAWKKRVRELPARTPRYPADVERGRSFC